MRIEFRREWMKYRAGDVTDQVAPGVADVLVMRRIAVPAPAPVPAPALDQSVPVDPVSPEPPVTDVSPGDEPPVDESPKTIRVRRNR